MKNIEIKTTQNVVLEYELAGLRDRAIAYFIDLVVLVVGMAILSVLGYGFMRLSGPGAIIYSIFLSLVFIFYAFVMEVLNNGKSTGKMAMRIQVIKTSGGQATVSDYAARWMFRAIDIYMTFGALASVMVASSSKGQRMGDIVANTAVIKTHARTEMNLDDLMAIHNQRDYKPTYLQVTQLGEDDMLLIKNVLDRYSRYSNNAHEEAVDLLVARLKYILEIENTGTNPRVFLQTLLRDYVVLTR